MAKKKTDQPAKAEERQAGVPSTKRKEVKLEKHKDVRIDEYYWLRERENPEVIQYLNDENAYLEKQLSDVKDLREKLFVEMKDRQMPADTSVADRIGDYYYYSRTEEGKDYPIYCRKKGSLSAPEEILIDVNKEAAGHDFFALRPVGFSPNQQIMAYAYDSVGRNFFTLKFRDLKTGRDLPDVIKDMRPTVAWANDNKTVFYVKPDPKTLRAYQVFRHELGGKTPDTLIYEEPDETFLLYVSKDKADDFIYITIDSTLSTEVRYLDANKPLSDFQIFQKREKDHEYNVESGGDRFYIKTNWKAKNFRLMEAPFDKTAKKNWKEVIGNRTDTLLEGLDIFKDYIAVQEKKKGLNQVRILERKGKKKIQKIEFPDESYSASLWPTHNFDDDKIVFTYESLAQPPSWYEYDLKTKKRTLLKQKELRGGFDPNKYVVKRLFAKAKDGTKIPISVVHRKDLKPNANTSMLIEGYGSYGMAYDPDFNSDIISLLDRGFVYALTHIRGGSDMGRAWYENGKLLKKKNTFTDFIAATEYMQKQKYSSPEHTYARGVSAGGLLMGAVFNMRPDLYHGMIFGVPFVDVLTTMLDETIPLTTFEYDEWGNPNQAKFYKYMKTYSPYDNIEAKAYPSILVTTGLHDSQVQYWEPAKFVARLRDRKTDQNLVLFYTEMSAGHGGKTGRFERLKKVALEWAYLLKQEQKVPASN